MDIEKIKIAIDTGDLQRAKNELDKVEKSAKSVDKSVGGITNSLMSFKGAVAAVATNAVITNLIKMSDTYSSIESRLKLATNSTKEYVKAQEALFTISQTTRTSLESTTELYAKIQLSTKSLKVSQEDLLSVTETINKTGIISGGSAESIKAALMQLGQAFGSGKLGGEELNSILEQTPRLAKAVADGLNVEVGALKSLAEQGAITSKVLFDAIKSQSNVVDIEFNGMAQTIGQSYTQIENSTLKVVGTFLNASGTTSTLSQSISDLSKSIDGSSASLVDFSIQVGAVFGRTVDMINLGYETLENTGQKIVGGIARTVYGVINSITSLSYESAKSLNSIGLTSDETLSKTKSIADTVRGAYDAAGRVMLESTDDLNNALQKANLTIEERVQISKAEYALSVKTAETRRKELDSLDSKTKKTKEQIESEAKAKKELERASEKQQKEQASALKEVNSAYLEMSRVGMSEYDKALSEIQEKTKEWIKTTGNKAEALKKEAVLIAELNKKRDDEVAKQALELERQRNEQIDKRITSLNREYDLKEKQVGLIYDETERNQALTKLYYERRVQEIELEKQKKEQSDSFYESQLTYEKNLLDQTLFRYSATGQIIESVSSGMKSTMMDFFDYTSAGFGDLKKMALDLGNIIYKAVIQQMVVNPLVGALSSAATSYFATPTPTTTGGGTYNGVTSTAFKWDGGISDGTTIKKFASGYIAGNRYASTDSLSNDRIPALISPGEAVIPASSVNQNRDLVQALISNRGRKFADGYIAPSVASPSGGNGVVKVEVINQTNQEVQVTNISTRNDLEGTILSVWINAVNTNKMGVRTMLGK